MMTPGVVAHSAFLSEVLAAVDLDFDTVDLGTAGGVRRMYRAGHLVRAVQAAHRDGIDQFLCARRQDSRLDLAGRDGIHPDAE